MQSSTSLRGKVAIVTGSSSGIGAGIAELFSNLGARVCITGRREDKLKEIAMKCQQASSENVQPLIVVGDITQQEVRERLIAATLQAFGKLDILINNAGAAPVADIEHTSLRELDDVMNINIRVPYHLTMLVLSHLTETKGCIVNISSVAGIKPNPNFLSYSMTKVALDAFTRCTAATLAPKGIRVNSVNPGFVPETDILKSTGDKVIQFFTQFLESKGLRPGKVDEIAKVVAFVVSDDASFMNGAIVAVDGGSLTVV